MSDIINSVDRALDILVLLYHEGKEMGISEIAREFNIYKSTVHRTMVTLENKGFIKQNKENGKYWLGMKLYAIGMVVGEKMSLKDIIQPFTKELYDEFKEVINVSILEKNTTDYPRSIIIHKEEDPRQVLTVNPPVGSSSECHCSSVGKCLLAFNNDIPFEKYMERPLQKYTEKTIDKWLDFMKLLEKVKEQGYAVDDEELEVGLTCIGAPILDRNGVAVAAISLSGPTQRMRSGDFQYKIERIRQIAKEISRQLR